VVQGGVRTTAPIQGPAPDGTGDVTFDRQASAGDGTPIIDARWRERVTVAGRVRSVRVAPLHDSPTLELVLIDDTGAISVVFLGRRALAGVEVGTEMRVEGMVGVHKTRLAILNPTYQLLA